MSADAAAPLCYPPPRLDGTTVNGTRSWSQESLPRREWSGSAIGLLELEPELGRVLTPEQRAAAGRFLLPVTTVDKDEDLEVLLDDSHGFGALVLDGLLVQTVQIGPRETLQMGPRETLQLIGPGAVVPAERGIGPAATRSRLRPAGETRLVLLGREFLLAAHHCPAAVVCLHHRMLEQFARLTRQLAICQLPRVEDRLLAMLRLLAESWGKVTPAGITLQLSLTHEMLGGLVGARRPTVSLGLKDLAERNIVVRRDDGWLITWEADDSASHGRRMPAPAWG